MNYNWDWGVLVRDPYLGWIVDGLGLTCLIALLAWTIGFTVGSAVGLARSTQVRWLRFVGTVYVEIFRNIPVLAQLFFWYFVFPELLPTEWGRFVKRGLPHPQFWTAVVGLGLYTAAKVAEQVRAGLAAIPAGQRNAALAVGLRPVQVYRYVLLPVAYRTIVPPLTSEFLGVFKNSSLALTLGVLELTAQARRIEEYTFQAFEAFACATVLYILVTAVVMTLMHVVERRTRIVGALAAGRA